MRNPKDNIVSFYHFSNVWADIETPKSFEQFLEDFLMGKGEIPQSLGNDDQFRLNDNYGTIKRENFVLKQKSVLCLC